MNDTIPTPDPQPSTTMATIIYVLYLVNLMIPVPVIILTGLIMAYVNRSDAPSFLQTHYQFQIRTFWIGLLYGFVGFVLTTIAIGWLILIFTLIWFIIRCAKGLMYLSRQQAIPQPSSWMFG